MFLKKLHVNGITTLVDKSPWDTESDLMLWNIYVLQLKLEKALLSF